MKIKTTTALKKISSLKKRIWGIQGGQGAGKTYAILLILLNFALGNLLRALFLNLYGIGVVPSILTHNILFKSTHYTKFGIFTHQRYSLVNE